MFFFLVCILCAAFRISVISLLLPSPESIIVIIIIIIFVGLNVVCRAAITTGILAYILTVNVCEYFAVFVGYFFFSDSRLFVCVFMCLWISLLSFFVCIFFFFLPLIISNTHTQTCIYPDNNNNNNNILLVTYIRIDFFLI